MRRTSQQESLGKRLPDEVVKRPSMKCSRQLEVDRESQSADDRQRTTDGRQDTGIETADKSPLMSVC